MTQYLSYAIEPDGIATITWHAPGPGPNTFNDVSMSELESAVRTLLADPSVRGMEVTSSKEDFIVGADLQMLLRVVGRSMLGVVVFLVAFRRILRSRRLLRVFRLVLSLLLTPTGNFW